MHYGNRFAEDHQLRTTRVTNFTFVAQVKQTAMSLPYTNGVVLVNEIKHNS